MNDITKKGRFIVFEGIDGSGKTTQAKILCKRLLKMNKSVESTKEPTDGYVGRLIRKALTGEVVLSEQAMSMLFAADRAEHILCGGGILEKINSGINIVSDRYYFSSYAYNNNSDLPMDWIIELNRPNRNLIKPDCIVFIDIGIDSAMERIIRNRGKTELYETKEKLLSVRKKFFEAFDKVDDNVVVVDADADINTVSERVWEKISYLFL